MAYSTQRAVSDGTLTLLPLTITYIDKEDIRVYYDNVEADPATWSWLDDTILGFDPAVPAGVEVLIARVTSLAQILHVFGPMPNGGGNAKFTNRTMDENFRQILMISQEAREGAGLTDIFQNVNFHGYKITNLGDGDPANPGDSVNMGQLFTLSGAAGTYANQAQTARNQAVAAQQAAAASEQDAEAAAVSAANSETAAAQSAEDAEAAQVAAANSADDAADSAQAAAVAETDAEAAAATAEYYATQVIGEQYAVPVGSVAWWATRASVQAGYAPADGQLLDAATYPDIVQMLLDGLLPVVTEAEWAADPLKRGSYTLGTGDTGATNFRMPDYNGQSAGSLGALFMRGDGAMSAGVAGLIQRDALQNIIGTISGINDRRVFSGGTGALRVVGADSLPADVGSSSSLGGRDVDFDASRVARTADETRSINVTGCWVVKLFGTLINPGSADAAQLASDYAALAGALQSLTGRVTALESRPRGLFTRGSLGNFSLPGGTYTLVNLAEAAPFNEGIIRVSAGVYAVAEAGMYAFSFCGQVAATTGTTRFLRVDVLAANSAVLKTYSDGFTGYSGTNALIAVDGLAWLDPSDTIQITAYHGDSSAQSQNGSENSWHFHLARVA